MRVPLPLTVPDRDALVLRSWIEGSAATGSVARRARIVLMSGQGLGPTKVSEELRCSKQTVITWRERYRVAGVDGLLDAPRTGRPATVRAESVVRRTLEAPPDGARRWTTRTLGADLGVSNASVGQVWRAWGVTPAGPGRVSLATDPVFDGRVAAVTGLHLGPDVRILALREGEPVEAEALHAGEEGIEQFLKHLADGPTTAVLAAGDPPVAPSGIAVHAVPPGLDWDRIARVACWIAGGACATALNAAVSEHRPGTTGSWLLR